MESKENLLLTTVLDDGSNSSGANILDPYGFRKNSGTSIDQIINTSAPRDRYYDNHFAYVKCDNITTQWVADKGFSYLNNPQNSSDNFFLPMSNEGFNMDFWNEKVTMNKISTQMMIQFIEGLNSLLNNCQEINEKRGGLLRKARLFLIFAFCFVLVSIMIVIFLSIALNDDSPAESVAILFVGELVSVIGFLLMIVMSLRKKKKTEFIVNKFIILRSEGVEEFISKWNEEKFLPAGIYVLLPRNLKYVQFVLNKNIRFCLANHKFPKDLENKFKGI